MPTASIAPLLAAYRKRVPHVGVASLAAPAGSPLPGVPILQQQFPLGSGQLNLVVEFAFGAIVSQPSTSWTWSDVTADVRYAQKITSTPGRANESSTPQPAHCAFTLLNTAGNYTRSPNSIYFPNVIKGTPVRVRFVYLGVSYTRFFGYATFTPGWDVTGTFATVSVDAYGAKQRLAQSDTPIASVLTRAIPTLPNLVGYWPCEDGTQATYLASGLPGGSVMAITGKPTLASNTALLSSAALPVMNTGTFTSEVVASTITGQAQIRACITLPPAASAPPNQSTLFRFVVAGSLQYYDILYNTGGGLQVRGINSVGAIIYDTGNITFTLDGQTFRLNVSLVNAGSNVTLSLSTYGQNAPVAGGVTNTIPNQSVNYPAGVIVAPNGDQTNVSVGQITIENAFSSVFDLAAQYNAFNGEYTGVRLSRLASEQGEYLDRTVGATWQLMGAQEPDTYINLMEGAAATELGVLYDGIGQGLTFIAQDEITSQPAAITLDCALGQLANEVAPVDDNQLTVNEFTATRNSGSTFTYLDTVSPLSTTQIGEYAGQVSLPFYEDSPQTTDFASWKVGVGTFNGYRYPSVEMWFHRNPELLPAWLAMRLESRIDIINVAQVRSQLPPGAVSQLAEGWSETIDQFTYSAVVNCTPYDPWRVGEVAQNTGDTNEFIMRPDTIGSTLAASVAPGATTASVNSTDSLLWTVFADDFPFDISIGGAQATVTGISGSSSPQTFSLTWHTPLPTVTLPAGAAVQLWRPCIVDVLQFLNSAEI